MMCSCSSTTGALTKSYYREGEFDVVMIANALHVMPDPVSALKEIDRVLKPGGILIAPNFIHSGVGGKTRIWTGLLKLFGIRFERQWTAETYPAFLAENGWQVVSSEVMHQSPVLTHKRLPENKFRTFIQSYCFR